MRLWLNCEIVGEEEGVNQKKKRRFETVAKGHGTGMRLQVHLEQASSMATS